jgi:hypothetical protein
MGDEAMLKAECDRLRKGVGLFAVASGDLSLCAYYQHSDGVGNFGPNTCSFDCIDEPECVTCEPMGGWPLQRFLAGDDDPFGEPHE